MSIKITIPNSSSDVLTFGSGNTPTAAQIAGIDSGSSNGQLAFYTTASGTSTERVRVDASGNVGIGTATPTYKLDVAQTSVDAVARIFANSTTTSSRLEITNGNGTTALNYSYLRFINSKTSSQDWRIGTYGNDNITFANATAGTTPMTLDTSGNLLVGKTVTSVGTAGTWIDATGALVSSLAASTASSSTLHAYSTTASAYRFYVGMDGRVNATLTTISAISDERLKENIKDLDFGLSEVLSLKPRRFDWKEGKGADTKDAVGFIAQEFETVFPNSVGTAKAGEDGIEYKNICHDELIPTLVKAIQELKALVDTQASTITSLTDRLTALENK